MDQENDDVTTLMLDSNHIGDSGAQCLACLLHDPVCYLQIVVSNRLLSVSNTVSYMYLHVYRYKCHVHI